MFLRLAVGGLFVWAATVKIIDPEGFAKSIFRYQIVPWGLINILAITLPFVELFAGAFLLFGIYKKGSSCIISIALFVFLLALLSARLRGLDIDCGCFATASAPSNSMGVFLAILRDLVMLLASLTIFIFGDADGMKNVEEDNSYVQEKKL